MRLHSPLKVLKWPRSFNLSQWCFCSLFQVRRSQNPWIQQSSGVAWPTVFTLLLHAWPHCLHFDPDLACLNPDGAENSQRSEEACRPGGVPLFWLPEQAGWAAWHAGEGGCSGPLSAAVPASSVCQQKASTQSKDKTLRAWLVTCN